MVGPCNHHLGLNCMVACRVAWTRPTWPFTATLYCSFDSKVIISNPSYYKIISHYGNTGTLPSATNGRLTKFWQPLLFLTFGGHVLFCAIFCQMYLFAKYFFFLFAECIVSYTRQNWIFCWVFYRLHSANVLFPECLMECTQQTSRHQHEFPVVSIILQLYIKYY